MNLQSLLKNEEEKKFSPQKNDSIIIEKIDAVLRIQKPVKKTVKKIVKKPIIKKPNIKEKQVDTKFSKEKQTIIYKTISK